MGKKRELRLPSDLSQIYKVEHFVEEISDEYHLNDSYFGNIMIALTEAVENSIIHAHQKDPEKTVHVTAEVKPEGLIIQVTDQGGGFDFRKYEDIDALLSLEEREARGISLMSSVSDEIKFLNKGKTVEMLFKITGIESDVYEKRYRTLKSYHREKSDGEKVDEKRDHEDEAEL